MWRLCGRSEQRQREGQRNYVRAVSKMTVTGLIPRNEIQTKERRGCCEEKSNG